MPHITRPTADDPRLELYRHLKKTNLTRWSGRFIAEGEKVVERLLCSPFEVESLLVSEKRTDFLDRVARDVKIYALPHAECERLIGFEFHQGILACGLRRKAEPLPELLAGHCVTVAVAARMTDPDNLGTLLRLASAFGLQAVILGPGSADPWSRRSLRVSMGAAFTVPIVESSDLSRTAGELKSLDFQLLATVLDPSAEPLMKSVRPDRLALVLGNEAQGLSPEEAALCDRAVTIPMSPSADSLNVSSAAAIFLYHFTRAAPSRSE